MNNNDRNYLITSALVDLKVQYREQDQELGLQDQDQDFKIQDLDLKKIQVETKNETLFRIRKLSKYELCIVIGIYLQ